MAKRIATPNITALRATWASTSFLAKLSDSAVRACLSVGTCHEYSARELLIREGQEDRNVYLLLSGCVKVTANLAEEGGEALLGIRVGGDVVGELAALDGRRRSANVQVCGRQLTRCCVVDPASFRRALTEDGDAVMTLAAAVGAKLRASTRRRVDYLRCDPVVRMARVLVELAEDHGQRVGDDTITIGVNLAQVELGTLIGVREATAQRALRALRAMDLVVTKHTRPVIRDLDRLRGVAQLRAGDGD